MLSSAIFFLALAASALANVYVGDCFFPSSPLPDGLPVADIPSRIHFVGQQTTITWQDDGQSPSLALFGAAKFSI